MLQRVDRACINLEPVVADGIGLRSGVWLLSFASQKLGSLSPLPLPSLLTHIDSHPHSTTSVDML